ncbi:MAG: hypothetical protein JWN22_2402 [Nocardioides sp.]|nr:hypothetical protein [Nocardioides sp.]
MATPSDDGTSGSPDALKALVEVELRYLQRSRERVVSRLDGLEEHAVRRPVTPTGTNLLGLVKHLALGELSYFDQCVGRPSGVEVPFEDDASYDDDLDMYALPGESRAWVLDLYRRAAAHTDATVRELGPGAPATVPWWREEVRQTTVGYLLTHVLHETAQHAGHADVLRELADGAAGPDHDERDAAGWAAHVARVQAAADGWTSPTAADTM